MPSTSNKAGGSRSCATEMHVCADAADAQERVPPELSTRHHPSRNSVMTYHDNRAIMLYVTVVTANRMPMLAFKAVADCILTAWRAANAWLVGRYVIMPDHVHFFCAPASYPPPDFRRWMKRWKSLATLAIRRLWAAQAGGSQLVATEAAGAGAGAINCAPPVEGTRDVPRMAQAGGSQLVATEAANVRNPPLWQRDCWDRQLRTGESYAQKWEYVRNNPVRKGLVANADDWLYQGELNVLDWHERN